MALISRLAQEITDEERQAGESQCFIGHEFHRRYLRTKLEGVLQEVGLHAYLADKEVTGEHVLDKVCRKILVSRASIVDLTAANPNVYFELGVAIGLNKPVFIVLKCGSEVPPLLESFVKLRFTSYDGMERHLAEQIPGWLEQSVEHHLLYSTHCHFVNVFCPERQRLNHQRKYLVIDQIESINEANQSVLIPDPDLRAELPPALDRFHFEPTFLDEIPTQDKGYRLCDYCCALRECDFSLCHVTRRTSPNAYLLLGLATGLDVPGLILIHEERDRSNQPLFEVPVVLRGVDAFYYQELVDIAELLAERVEVFLNRLNSRPLSGKRLLFSAQVRRLDLESVPEVSALVDVRGILGQPIEAVTDTLGEPQSTDRREYRVLNEYRVGEETVQIEFHGEVAAFVSCELGSLGLTEDEQALRQLGLSPPAMPPTIDNRQLRLKQWEPCEPFGRLTIYYDNDRTIRSVAVVTREAVRSMQGETETARASLDVRRALAAIRESLLSTADDSPSVGLSASLRARCRDALLRCSEFDSFASLRAVFVTEALFPFRIGLPDAPSKTDRVAATIDYLSSGRPIDGRSALLVFLSTLHNHYSHGDALRDQLEELRVEIEYALDERHPSERLIDIVPEIVELGDTAVLDEALVLAQLLTRPSQQGEALVALIDALTQMNYLEGARRVVEIALTLEESSIRGQVLDAVADAYRSLGQEEKAQEVSLLQEEQKQAQPTADLVLRGVIRILEADGSTAGTGFIINDGGLVATCASVVRAAGIGPGERISIGFRAGGHRVQALVLPEAWSEQGDVAILQVEEILPSGLEPMSLGISEESAGRSFRAFGFPTHLKEGLWARGETLGEISSHSQRFMQLRSKGLPVGFSGAPIWDEETGEVVGMVTTVSMTDQYSRRRDVAFAVPAEIIQAARLSVRGRAGAASISTTEVNTGARPVFPFDDLSPSDFEQLCLELVKREGYQQVEQSGAAGRPYQGQDIVARRNGEVWAFQCKRVQHFYPALALADIEKVLSLPEGERPAILVFVTTGDVSAKTREEAINRCAGEMMECRFWTRADLEETVRRHPSIIEDFFPSRVTQYRAPFQAPALPSHHIARPEFSGNLKTRLLTGGTTAPGASTVSAVCGIGGIGKTTLAASLAQDPEVQARFPDGVLWVTLSQHPDVLSLLMDWIQALGDYDFRTTLPEGASAHLRTLLHDKACLLVVDDAQQADHARAFLVGGDRCRALITSRDPALGHSVGARVYDLDVMAESQALALFEARLGPLGSDQEQAMALARELGHLPLALELVAAQVAAGYSWSELLEVFRRQPVALPTEAPYSPREQVSEALSQLRSKHELRGHQQTVRGGLRYNSETGQIELDGEDITRELSPPQYDLLVFMYQRPGVICTRDEIAEAVWPDAMVTSITDTQIYELVKRVRAKVEPDPRNPRYIVTVRGHGYRLEKSQD